jgi:hypothetical protein
MFAKSSPECIAERCGQTVSIHIPHSRDIAAHRLVPPIRQRFPVAPVGRNPCQMPDHAFQVQLFSLFHQRFRYVSFEPFHRPIQFVGASPADAAGGRQRDRMFFLAEVQTDSPASPAITYAQRDGRDTV